MKCPKCNKEMQATMTINLKREKEFGQGCLECGVFKKQ